MVTSVTKNLSVGKATGYPPAQPMRDRGGTPIASGPRG